MFILVLDMLPSRRWQGVWTDMLMVRQIKFARGVNSGRRFGGNRCGALKVRAY